MVYKIVLFLSLMPTLCLANQPWSKSGTISTDVPAEIKDVGIKENLGGQVNLGLTFKNEKGEPVTLQKYFDGKRPVLMTLVYFECPMLCNLILNGVVDSFKKLDWRMGKEFDMVVVSIDPKETPELANKKKESYLKDLGLPETAKGWHFLTGTEENIKALAGSVGFSYKWDEAGKQWAHNAAIYALTPKGIISRYLYGITFQIKDLKMALLEAADGKIGSVMDQLMLYCFQYNPDRRTYAFYAYNIMKFGGGLCMLLFAAFLIPQWLRIRRETKLTKGEAT